MTAHLHGKSYSRSMETYDVVVLGGGSAAETVPFVAEAVARLRRERDDGDSNRQPCESKSCPDHLDSPIERARR